MNNKTIIDTVKDSLIPVLPNGWNKVCFYADVSECSYEIFYYVFTPEYQKPIQCYDLQEKYSITEEKIDTVFHSLSEKLRQFRQNATPKWSILTVIMHSDGHSEKVFYEEDTHAEDLFYFKRDWMERYLNSN